MKRKNALLLMTMLLSTIIVGCDRPVLFLETSPDYRQNGANCMQFGIANVDGYTIDDQQIRAWCTLGLKCMSGDLQAQVYEIWYVRGKTGVVGQFWFYYPNQSWPRKTLPESFIKSF